MNINTALAAIEAAEAGFRTIFLCHNKAHARRTMERILYALYRPSMTAYRKDMTIRITRGGFIQFRSVGDSPDKFRGIESEFVFVEGADVHAPIDLLELTEFKNVVEKMRRAKNFS